MEFVRYFLQSTDLLRPVDAAKTGTVLQHFGPTHLDAMYAPRYQPVEYQMRAVASMSRAGQHLEVSRDARASQIERLQERRQALVTAAVSGELEIPGVAAMRARAPGRCRCRRRWSVTEHGVGDRLRVFQRSISGDISWSGVANRTSVR